jgi:glycerol-3-phosphate O-acyltransferase/dihydroxyacetone phosphate acyltransferase
MRRELTVRSLRPLFLSIWPGNQREVNKLREMREGLANDISEIIDEFGPKLYENFHQVSWRRTD